MRRITKLEPSVVPKLPQRKRVAAYARISMVTEKMLNSLSNQVSAYSAKIQANPEWEYAGIYVDEGITGTKVLKRQEFMRMLEDCEAGKIDIIITKSISRFARNTIDLLEVVRHLKEINVEVRFEKEHISTFSSDGELMLTVLASFAEEEVRSVSENLKWARRKGYEKGKTPHMYVYGYKWCGDELKIVPEEAEVVRRIFQNFLDGKSRLETERELTAAGITTRAGTGTIFPFVMYL